VRSDVRDSGFSLIEVLVAAAIIVVTTTTVASLVTRSAVMNEVSNDVTRASLLASDKMEQLRALPFDDPALAASPPGSLDVDVEGYSDTIDARYGRRWSIEPLPADPAAAIVIQVVVTPLRGPGQARIVTVRARHAP